MIKKSTPRVIYGAIINPISLRELQALPRALIAISETGIIEWIMADVESSLVQEVMLQKGWMIEDVDFLELKAGQWIMPGFIDTHTHAPQYLNIGSGQQYELLDWLANVTFPAESKFSDIDFAQKVYSSVVRRVLDCGTTTCCYYGTLHLDATKALADIVQKMGQRAYVGKCNMDRNSSATYQEPSWEDSVRETKLLISHIRSLSTPNSPSLVHPILTPRFAIACSTPLLEGLGKLAAEDQSLAIQTHISENPSEIAFTKQLFPESPSYAGVYDSFGLLRRNTILAHGCHLSDDEFALIKSREAGISHCPTSNFNLRSGLANVGSMLDRGIKVGLGTDVSGGFSPSILTAVQHASICSKIISLQHVDVPAEGAFTGRQLSIPALVYLATLGGAEVCGLSDTVGSFMVGKEFDALLVDLQPQEGSPGTGFLGLSGDKEDLLQRLERFLFCGDDRNISSVFVRGQVVGGTRMSH